MQQADNKSTSSGARNSDKEIVIITGSSGLIGTRIIKRLGKNFRIIGLDKAGNPFPPVKAECISFDLTKEDSIRAAMERVRYGYGENIASVIHLAAYYDFSGEPSPLYEEVTVKGTEKFLKVLQDFNVEQFVFSSTNLIYKPTDPGQDIDEDSPVEPNWDYPESKVDTEDIIREQRGDIHAVLLRLAGVYDEEGSFHPHLTPDTAHLRKTIHQSFLLRRYLSRQRLSAHGRPARCAGKDGGKEKRTSRRNSHQYRRARNSQL